jgi:subtilisin family serine protease
MAMKPERERPWKERVHRELVCRDRPRHKDVVPGDNSWFRPSQLIVNKATLGTYADVLRRDEQRDEGFGGRDDDGGGIDLVQIHLEPGRDVLDLTEWIRRDAARRDISDQVVVGPNYCWRGEPRYQGGPGGEPHPADPFELVADGKAAGRADIATLDTGFLPGLPEPLAACLQPDTDDEEQLDADGNGVLDTQNGHGSFVAGVVHQVAPELVIDPGKVLDSTGLGDDASVTRELLQNTAPVVNLSLGGYTEDDRPPVAMAEVVRRLTRSRVVVAAAGNNGSDRPFWPAAFKGVLAVAAYDSRGGQPRPAKFSNHGTWVDVCAPGVDVVSTFATFEQGGTPGVTFKGFARWSGTSFAAPQVAALLAQRVREGVSPREAVAWLLDDACHFEPALARYGLVLEPPKTLMLARG